MSISSYFKKILTGKDKYTGCGTPVGTPDILIRLNDKLINYTK